MLFKQYLACRTVHYYTMFDDFRLISLRIVYIFPSAAKKLTGVMELIR